MTCRDDMGFRFLLTAHDVASPPSRILPSHLPSSEEGSLVIVVSHYLVDQIVSGGRRARSQRLPLYSFCQ